MEYGKEPELKKDIELRLADSLKALVLKVPFEKITIRQITDGAGVIRVTFYNHFQDKYDLLEWIMRTEIMDPVRILLTNHMYREALVLIFSNMKKEEAFYRKISHMEGQNSFREIITGSIRNLLLDVFSEAQEKSRSKPKHPWLTPEYLAAYYAQSMSFVVLVWIQRGMPIEPEELAVVYEYIATRSLFDIMEELHWSSEENPVGFS